MMAILRAQLSHYVIWGHLKEQRHGSHILKSLTNIFKFVVCNPSYSSPSLTRRGTGGKYSFSLTFSQFPHLPIANIHSGPPSSPPPNFFGPFLFSSYSIPPHPLTPLSMFIIPLVFFYLNKLLFSGPLQFKGDFMRGRSTLPELL